MYSSQNVQHGFDGVHNQFTQECKCQVTDTACCPVQLKMFKDGVFAEGRVGC